MHRCLKAWYQPLIGVDQGGQNGTHPTGMLQQTSDEVAGRRREAVGITRIGESIMSSHPIDQALVQVHTAPIDAGDRFGHEGGVEGVELSNSLDRQACRNGLISSLDHLGMAQIDLVLTCSYLVV